MGYVGLTGTSQPMWLAEKRPGLAARSLPHAMSLNEYFGAERVDLSQVAFTPELLRCIPAQVARHYRVLPVFDNPPVCLRVAFADPIDLDAVDGTHHVLKRELELRVADPQQVDEFIDRLYGSA